MIITIKAETDKEKEILKSEEVVFDNVKRYVLTGLRLDDGITPDDFSSYSSDSKLWLVEKAYSSLKSFEKL